MLQTPLQSTVHRTVLSWHGTRCHRTGQTAPHPPHCEAMGNILCTNVVRFRRAVRRLWHLPRSLLGVHGGVSSEGNPVPEPSHVTVNTAQLKPGRLVLVGDVHGCCTELQQLLKSVKFDTVQDNLVLLGDIVNKGSQNLEVLALARTLKPFIIRGNHDDAALHAYYLWKRGDSSFKPTFEWVSGLTAEDAQLLLQLPFSIAFPGYGVAVVHAGLLPDRPLEQQLLSHLYKMRDLFQDAQGRWVGVEEPCEGSQPWASQWPGPQHIFFGHDARRKLQLYPYATGLDTGCVYGGQLTAVVLPPLGQLQADPAFAAKLAAGEPLTLKDLQGQLASVDKAVQ